MFRDTPDAEFHFYNIKNEDKIHLNDIAKMLNSDKEELMFEIEGKFFFPSHSTIRRYNNSDSIIKDMIVYEEYEPYMIKNVKQYPDRIVCDLYCINFSEVINFTEETLKKIEADKMNNDEFETLLNDASQELFIFDDDGEFEDVVLENVIIYKLID